MMFLIFKETTTTAYAIAFPNKHDSHEIPMKTKFTYVKCNRWIEVASDIFIFLSVRTFLLKLKKNHIFPFHE